MKKTKFPIIASIGLAGIATGIEGCSNLDRRIDYSNDNMVVWVEFNKELTVQDPDGIEEIRYNGRWMRIRKDFSKRDDIVTEYTFEVPFKPGKFRIEVKDKKGNRYIEDLIKLKDNDIVPDFESPNFVDRTIID